MEHSTDKGQDLQTGVYEHNWCLTVLRPDGSISARQWDRMPWPDVKGKRCLDVWTFDESLRFEMAGYRVTNLAGDPGYRGASKGAAWSGLAGLGGSPNVGICLTPSATRLSRHVRISRCHRRRRETVFTYAGLRVHRSAAAPL